MLVGVRPCQHRRPVVTSRDRKVQLTLPSQFQTSEKRLRLLVIACRQPFLTCRIYLILIEDIGNQVVGYRTVKTCLVLLDVRERSTDISHQ